MSKMDNLRAMREARYAEAQERAAARPARAVARPPVAPPAPAREPASGVAAQTGAGDGLCGHRNMGGRTCTREHGHAAKTHRYS